MKLHTVNQAPGSTLDCCLRCISPEDSLLLLEDGVYAGCAGLADAIVAAGCKLYVLEPDAAARGLLHRLDHSVELIDYAGFVELAADCDAVQSWY